MNPSFIEIIRKRNNLFWIYSTGNRQKWQQQLQRKAHSVGKRYNNNFNTAYNAQINNNNNYNRYNKI